MVSLKDIAEKTGLSKMTVSRALQEGSSVSAATRESVRACARKLGYRPHLAARSLRTGCSRTLCAVCGEPDERGFARLAAFVETSRAAGYDVTVMFVSGGDSRAAARLADGIFAARAGGVAVFPDKTSLGELVAALQAGGMPCVAADMDLSPADRPAGTTVEEGNRLTDRVSIDRQWGMQEAVRHLIAGGRRRIVYAGLDRANSRGRYEGYCRGLDAFGLSPESIITRGHQFADGRTAADRLLAMRARPDAVVTFDDPLALGILNRFLELGVKVPEEVALVGFDDRPAAAMTYPELTTVSLPNRELGQAAAEILLRRIAGDSAPAGALSVTVKTQLVVRRSA